jgi:hypothetical protein
LAEQHAGKQDGENEQQGLPDPRGHAPGKGFQTGRAGGWGQSQGRAHHFRLRCHSPRLVDKQGDLARGAAAPSHGAGEMRCSQPAVENTEHGMLVVGQKAVALRGQVGLGFFMTELDQLFRAGERR